MGSLKKIMKNHILKNTVVYGLLFLWFVVSVFPFIWTILTSIKDPVDAFAMPPKWSFEPTLNAYKQLWLEGEFVRYLKNTIFVTGGSVLISLVVGLPAGYAIARYSKSSSFLLLLLSLLFRALPRTLFILPFYHIATITGLYDTKFLLIMIMVAINQPFTIWMLRSFFMSIPESLEEAAMIDGCTRFQAFRRVIIPIMGPGVITAGIFTLLLAYNEYFIPVVLTANRAVTMPVAIAQFGVDSIKEWSISAAGATSIALPIVIIVIFAQKYIVEGMAAGSVKE
jgi:multiple sugar transport system permease protein